MSDKIETLVDAESIIESEIEKTLLELRSVKVGRVDRADREIPLKYAEITGLENQIEGYRLDRIYFTEQVRVLDVRLKALKDTR